MFLRNLKILSRMKWTLCGLLLIPAIFCTPEKSDLKKQCEKNKHACDILNHIIPSTGNNAEKHIFILGTDGFMGHMEKGESWTRSQSQSDIWCNNSFGLPAVRKLFNISVFSFEDNTTSPSTTYGSDFSLSLSKDSKNSAYQLNISRSIITDLCVIDGACKNYTWAKWIAAKGFNRSTNCSMTCLNPTNECKSAKYDSRCRDDNAGDESKINTIEIYNGTATCIKCGSPFQKVEEIKELPQEMAHLFNNTNERETDAGAAAVAMKNLTNLLSLMGNLTIASISMGSVTGVLKKIQSVSDVQESAFIYSAETGIRVIDDFSILKNYTTAFTIPKEATLQAFNKSAGKAFLGVFRFPNMSKDENNSTVLGNEVYAIEMGITISNLTENISLAFSNKESMMGTPVCHSWDGKEAIPQSDLVALTYITYIGCGLSMFFLGVGLFIHFLLRRAKATNSAHVLMNLFLALFLLNLAFLSNEYVARANSHSACKVMAGFMHYSLLASFSWFAVEALHLCLQMAKHSVVIKHYILKISVAGWAPPAVVVSIIFILGKYGEQTIQTDSSNVTMCWILDNTVHYVVNIGYYCFVFIFTSCTCIVVLRWLSMLKLSKFNKAGAVKRSGTASFDINTILGLCCMLGLTWSFTFFSYGSLRLPSYYIFTILNSFQGFFLFIYYMKTSSLFGDSVPAEDSDITEDTNTENPYDNQIPTPAKKTI
ncbi:unnamed protein product [Leuciscus chuanchicus]